MKKLSITILLLATCLCCLIASVETNANLNITGYKNSAVSSDEGNFTLTMQSYNSMYIGEGSKVILDDSFKSNTATPFFTWNLSRNYSSSSATTGTIGTLSFSVGLLKSASNSNGDYFNPAYSLSFNVNSSNGDVFRPSTSSKRYYATTSSSMSQSASVAAGKNNNNSSSQFAYVIKYVRQYNTSETNSIMNYGGTGSIKITGFHQDVANLELTYTADVTVEFTAN